MGCMSVLAFLLMDLGIIACLISFCAPFWILDKSLVSQGADAINKGLDLLGVNTKITIKHQGLWGYCSDEMKCVGVWENDFQIEKTFDDWKKASQGLYAGGVILILVSILISSMHICCSCCKSSYSIKSALGSLTLAGVLCIAAALAIYGGFSHKEGHLSSTSVLDWGFWLGVAGVVSCLASSLLFFFDSCCGSRHEGYHMTRVV